MARVRLLERDREPCARGRVEGWCRGGEVALVLEPQMLGLVEQRDLGANERRAAPGDSAQLGDRARDGGLAAKAPDVAVGLLEEDVEERRVRDEAVGVRRNRRSATRPYLVHCGREHRAVPGFEHP